MARVRWLRLGLVVGLLAAMVATAQGLGTRAGIFPELGALGIGVLGYRLVPWRARLADIALFPPLGALVGVALARLPWPFLGLWLLGLVFVLGLLRIGRSKLVPTISACMLPILLGERSFVYPAAVALWCLVLAGVTLAEARLTATAAPPGPIADPSGPTAVPPGPARQAQEAGSPEAARVAAFVLSVAVWSAVAVGAGERLLVVPPLLVATWELVVGGGKQAARKAAMLALAAGVGAAGRVLVGPPVLDVVVVVVVVVAILEAGHVALPPALALAVIPLLFKRSSAWSVGGFVAAGAVGITLVAVTIAAVTPRMLGWARGRTEARRVR